MWLQKNRALARSAIFLNLVPNAYKLLTLLAKQFGRFSFQTKMYPEIISFEIFKRPK